MPLCPSNLFFSLPPLSLFSQSSAGGDAPDLHVDDRGNAWDVSSLAVASSSHSLPSAASYSPSGLMKTTKTDRLIS